MDKLPFGIYDFFAYLSAGGVLLLTADYVGGLGLVGMKDVGPVLGIAFVVLAYAVGHVVAHFSSLLFEQILVGKVLGRPAALLMDAGPRSQVAVWLFPNYHRRLPINVQQRVKDQARSRTCNAVDEGLFLHAYPIVTQNEKFQARLDVFLNLYGFARNMGFSFLVSAIVITIAHWYSSHPVRLRWAVFAVVGGLCLFYRYLKFFRQYAFELFIRYAELPRAGETKAASPGA